MLYNREEALKFLGKVCNDLNILRDRKYDVSSQDFEDNLHKLIFGALQNLALQKDLVQADGFIIDSYLRQIPSKYVTFQNRQGIEIVDSYKEISKGSSLSYAYDTLKKFSLLRRFNMVGMDVRDIYDENTLDINKLEAQRINLQKMTIDDIKKYFKLKIIEIDLEFQTKTESYSFKAGQDLDSLLERCINGTSWGVTFQSELYNAIFRGQLGSKFMLRSAGTGGSKTRMSIGDMCNIAVSERYIPHKKEWVKNDNTQEVTFISTELTEDEVNLAILATVSGVKEEIIKDGKYSEEIMYRLRKASNLIKESKIHCEYNSDFNISEIENIIEKNIIRNNTKFIYFDYIQVTANLARELSGLFGYTLREDQMLSQLSTALKNLANKYDVFILSSTQLNRSYKTDGYVDVTHLRGGMATADKCDYVVITMKVTKADLEKLKPIIEVGFDKIPTHGHHVCKNRGGKWVGIIIWTHTDLDTINTEDCFVTTQDFEFINTITPVKLV